MALIRRKPRVVHVHLWARSGVGIVTVWLRYKGELLASTTWQTFDKQSGAYAPHSMESVKVDRLGEWRPGDMVENWHEDGEA